MHRYTQTILDNFRNVVDSKLQKHLTSYGRKLYSVMGLTIDEASQDIPVKHHGYNNAMRSRSFPALLFSAGQLIKDS